MDESLISSLDRRVADHDKKIADTQRDYTELSHSIQELLNRLNNGLSPSVQSVLKENAEIKLSISELSHELKLSTLEMKGVVRETAEHTRLMIKNFDDHKLIPVANEVGFIKKTFIYGLVGALIVFLGQKGMSVLWDKVFRQDVSIVGPR